MARILRASLLAALFAAGCAAPAPVEPPPDAAALADRLASRDAAVRDAAEIALFKLGDPAERLLRARLDMSGVELRGRIADVLLRFEEARASKLRLRLVGEYRLKGGRATAVAFSADGAFVAAGSEEGAIAVWDTARGFVQSRIEGLFGAISALAFSPDGGRLVVSCGSEISVWDLATGQCAARFPASRVSPLVWSRNGRWIVYASGEGQLQMVQADALRMSRTIEAGPGRVVSLAESPAGDRLAAGMETGAAVDIDTEHGERMPWTATSGTGSVLSIECLPGGGRVELREEGQLRIGSRREQVSPRASEALSAPGGDVAVLAGDGPAILIGPRTTEFFRTGGVENFLHGRFSPAGDFAGIDVSGRLWLIRKEEKVLLEGLSMRLDAAVISRDGRCLGYSGAGIGVLRSLETGLEERVPSVSGLTPDATTAGIRVSILEQRPRARIYDARVFTWNPDLPARRIGEKRLDRMESLGNPVLVAPDGRFAVSQPFLRELATGDETALDTRSGFWPERGLWSPSGRWYAWTERSMDNGLEMAVHVMARGGSEVFRADSCAETSMSFNASETEFSWTNGVDTLETRSLPDFKLIHHGPAGHLFSHLGDRLAVTCERDRLGLWFVPTLKRVAEWPCEEFFSVSSSADGRTFAIRTAWSCRVYRLED